MTHINPSTSANSPTRRRFLRTAAACAGALALPWPDSPAAGAPKSGHLRFGLIADVHQDIMHDGEQRLKAFLDRMRTADVDFIIQLGDFATPAPKNQAFFDLWRSFEGPRYHVLGNHDMDGGFTREQTVAHWKMPAPYYAFQAPGVHCLVLDGNDPGPGQKPYYRYVGDAQAKWLEEQLTAATLPVLIFIHQPIDHDQWGIENHAQILRILERANQPRRKIAACFSGHLHRDYGRTIAHIPCVQINSASYFWLGSQFAHPSYDPAIHRQHSAIQFTAPYKDPLWALATIDFAARQLTLEGRSTQFVGPSPWDLGADREKFDAATVAPAISSRQLALAL